MMNNVVLIGLEYKYHMISKQYTFQVDESNNIWMTLLHFLDFHFIAYVWQSKFCQEFHVHSWDLRVKTGR